MNIQDLGSLGELVAAIATVVTLIYLALQIRQNNQQGQAEAEREWLVNWHLVVRNLGDTEQVAALIRTGLNDYHSLTKNEMLQFHARFCQIPDHVDVGHRMHEKGLMSDQMHEAVIKVGLAYIRTPGGIEYWKEVGPLFGIYPYFESLKDRVVAPITETIPFFGQD